MAEDKFKCTHCHQWKVLTEMYENGLNGYPALCLDCVEKKPMPGDTVYLKVDPQHYSHADVRHLCRTYPLQVKANDIQSEHDRGLDEDCEDGGKHMWLVLPPELYGPGQKRYLLCLKCRQGSHL
jgi:hypothetical protein